LKIVVINHSVWNNQFHIMWLVFLKNDVRVHFDLRLHFYYIFSWLCDFTSFWTITNHSCPYSTRLSFTCRSNSQSRSNYGFTTIQ
jgi:hypothetical protein